MSLSERYLQSLQIDKCLPTLELLDLILRRHIEFFSFNNIEILLKPEAILSLETDHLYRKIVVESRGGYCFEHNKLLFEVLRDLELEVQSYLGRVVYGAAKDVPRSHRLIILTHRSQEFLLDVGFGPNTPGKLIALNAKDHDYWVQQQAETYELRTLKDDEPFVLYTFDRGNYRESDFMTANFYTNRHPNSKFTQNLIVSRKRENETFLITGLRFRTLSSHGAEEVLIQSSAQLRGLLQETMKVEISESQCQKIFHFCQARKSQPT